MPGSVNMEAVVLPNVGHVPGLSMNLVLVGQITEDPDLVIKIGGGACRINKNSNG